MGVRLEIIIGIVSDFTMVCFKVISFNVKQNMQVVLQLKGADIIKKYDVMGRNSNPILTPDKVPTIWIISCLSTHY